MRITILTTDPTHPVVAKLIEWKNLLANFKHEVDIFFDKANLQGGDILFLVSCGQLIKQDDQSKFTSTFVLHASDLPKGRGWSPHIWSIVEGKDVITVCLLEASSPIDSGDIWLKDSFTLEGHELLPEINEKLFDLEIRLMSELIENYESIVPDRQVGESGGYLRKRTPEDSKIDIDQVLSKQINLLRVVDNERYPAFFEHMGIKYIIKIEKNNGN
jgi:methionyl-tRNA formyltransferase